MSIKVDPEWWKTLFDEIYLLTDARSVCEDEVTRREVDMICELIPICPWDRILDLCGGQGRHCFELSGRGYTRCTVFDYSAFLINHGSTCAMDQDKLIDFVQGDARSTGLKSGTFDCVLIMGNSLGYILDGDADNLILCEARRVLCPGGWLLIDVVEGVSITKNFNPIAWHEIGNDIIVCRQREIHDRVICSRELVISKERGLVCDRTYSMRFYNPKSLEALVYEAGFTRIKIHTEFTPHTVKGDYGFMNHRMMVTCQKP